MTVIFRVLGSLEAAHDEGTIDLGSHRQRAVLAFLLTRPNTVVSTDSILDAVWGEAEGADKQNALWVYVSGLRSALEPNRAKRTDGTVLLTRSPGYVLQVGEGGTDAAVFEHKLSEARAMLDTDPAGAGLTLQEALGLWRGTPYADFTYEAWAAPEIARLDELRLTALELRIDADLRVGADASLIPELEALTHQHPLREAFVGQRMIALHRSGRTAEALRLYTAHAERLGSELGIEPARSLRTLEERIVTDDPDLLAPARGSEGSGLGIRGYELRDKIGAGAFGVAYEAFQPTVGRAVAVKVVRPELANDPTFIRRFESEARLVARLEHPHIVPLYDYWREPDAAYLVMRLMKGGSLGAAIEDRALPSPAAATMFGQLGDALFAAHRMGVIHRDIKPANILLDDDGNAFLSDFGVAQGPGGPDGSPSSTLPAPYASPEARSGSATDERSDIYSLAVVAAQTLTGLAGEYDQIRGALEPAVAAVLDRATSADPMLRFPDAREFSDALVEAIGSVPLEVEPTVLENPYKGLRAFSTADASDYFGRDRLVARLLSRVGDPGHAGRFVALVGPSGSGKSSAVKAGLLPAVAAGALPHARHWFTLQVTPGEHPFESLEDGLLGIAARRPAHLLDTLLTDGGLTRAIGEIIPAEARLLLVIDQFEELYTLTDQETRDRFVAALADLVAAGDSRCHVVITLRADFYDRPLADHRLGELLREGTEVVTPMGRSELQAAIVGPAQRQGVTVSPVVVERLVDETLDRPGTLPLLQHTLTELFEHRTGSTIDEAALDRSGGVSASLVRRADSIMEGLGKGASEVTRQVFLRLVSVGDDGINDTRRRVLVSSLEGLGRAEQVRRVLDGFGRHRLLSFDRDPVCRAPTVEISHEALLSEWGRFRAWVEQARSDLATHRRLVSAIQEWGAADRSPDYLLRAGRLAVATEWAESTAVSLSTSEREFIAASSAAQEARDAEEQEREQQAAASSARARRRSRQLGAAVLASLVVLALAAFAFVQRQDAVVAEAESTGIQEASQLAIASTSVLGTDSELALLLAIEAVKTTADLGFATPEAIDALHWALQDRGVTYPVDPDTPRYARRGPFGTVGVWGLSVERLTSFAEESVAPRRLSPDECAVFAAGSDCPSDASVSGLTVLGGIEAYASAAAADQVEVTVVSPFGGGDRVEVDAALAVVAEDLGITIRQVRLSGNVLESVLGEPKDPIYILAQPGVFQPLVEARPILEVSAFLDPVDLEHDFSPYLISLARADDGGQDPSPDRSLYAVPFKVDAKSIVWTRASVFAARGYPTPETWAEFDGLMRESAALGETPICLALESDNASGWPGTDLVENLVLRSQGPDYYDAWIAHEIPFDDPGVVKALRMAGSLAANGYLRAGRFASETPFWQSAVELWTTEEPACLVLPGATFMPSLVEDEERLDRGVFGFPSVNPAFDDAMVGGGAFAIGIADRPEVRDVLAAIASPSWLSTSARASTPGLLPGNTRFDMAEFVDPDFRTITELVHDALRSDAYRFDASDLMPPEIGLVGAFPQGMLRLFEEATPENVDDLALEIAREIEAAWVALEADEADTDAG